MKKLLSLIFLLPVLAACPPLEEWEKLRGIEFYVENQTGEPVYIEYDGRAKTIEPTESFHARARDSRSASELHFGREDLKRFGSFSLPNDSCFFTIPIQKLRENWESNKGRFSDELLGIFTAYPVRIDSEYDERDGRQIYKWIFEVKESWLAAGKASEDSESMPAGIEGTMLVYMAADNDLYTAALDDINEMEAGWNASVPLYVFLDPPQNSPFNQPLIFRIVHDETDEIVSPVVKVFLQEIDSASKNGMVSVLSEAGFYFDKLILWSHSTGWLPENIDYNRIPLQDTPAGTADTGADTASRIASRTFAVDDTAGSRMSIRDLASVFESSFQVGTLVFDSCRMGTVEVFAEFSAASIQRIIAPATDIDAGGLYYTTLAGMSRWEEIDLNKAVAEYKSAGGGELMLVGCRPKDFGSTGSFVRQLENRDSVQRSDMKPMQTPESGYAVVFYDFFHFLDQAVSAETAATLKEVFETAPEGASPGFYLPYTTAENPSSVLKEINAAFLNTVWGKAVSFSDVALPSGTGLD